jgi:tetratricopeptide (TPR) repeat protein
MAMAWGLAPAARRNAIALGVVPCALGQSAYISWAGELSDESLLALRCPAWREERTTPQNLEGLRVENAVDALLLGQAWEEQSETGRALALWERFPETAGAFQFACTRGLRERDCGAAVAACERAVGIDPRRGAAFGELGRVYAYCSGELDDALEAFETAEGLGTDSTTVWLAHAHTLNRLGDRRQAAALVEDHGLTGALADAILADDARARGDLAAARELYERAITQDPRDPWLYHGLAATLVEMGRKDEAVLAWRKALEVNPEFEPARKGIAEIQGQE